MIYFMQPTAGGAVKIGFTDDIDTRRKALESYYGRPLALLATMPGGPDEEAEIHARFGHLRFDGPGRRGRRPEQFRPAPELMAFIGRPLLVTADPETVEMMPYPKTSVVSVKMTTGFRDWLAEVANADRITTVQLIEKAVVEYAERHKHPTPAPRRTEGR